MTVNSTVETRKQFTGDSNNTTSTDFTVNFNYLSTSEIQVVHTDTTTATDTNYVEGTHYSVQSGASASSVTIRFLSGHVPTATTEYVTISRNMTLSQDTDYTEGSTLDAETLEQNFDKAIMISQQIKNNVTDLNLSFSETNDFNTTAAAASDITVSKANRASKALKFDANGDAGVSTYDPDEQVTLAAAQVALASGHASTASGHADTASGHKDTASTAATNAAASEAAAAASAAAAAAVFDTFDDKYLGVMADNASAVDVVLAGASCAEGASSITFTGITSGSVVIGQELTSTGTGYPSSANIIGTSTTSPITISAPFTSAISGVSLTFEGQGVYGDWDAAKDGPSTDNDGNALVNGALYFNSTDGEMRVYDANSGVWIVASAAQNATVEDYTYTLTGSDSTISGADDNSATLSFSNQESVDVFLNGVKLVPKINSDANDYHLDTSNTVTLTSAAVSGDVILVRVYKTFTVADAVPASTGGTFSGNVAVNGDLTVDTDTLKVDSANNIIGIGTNSPYSLMRMHVKSTTSSGSGSRGIRVENTSASGYAEQQFKSDTREFRIGTGGSSTSDSGDLYFYDATGTATRLIIDSSGNVGIGTNSPATTTDNRKNLQVGLGATVIGRTDDTANFLSSNLTYNSGWKYIADTTASQVELGTNIEFHTAVSGTAGNPATLTERMRIANSGDGDVTVQTGNLVIGTAGKGITVPTTSHTFTVKGINEAIGDSQSGTAPDTTDSDSGQFAVYNGATKLLGITEHGYVLKPNQPMCCVRRVGGNQSATEVILFDHTPTNIGSHYDSSNGRFTCPVSGQYEVHIGAHAQNTSTLVIQTRKNGSVYQEEYQNGAAYGHVSVASIITCSAGDYIDARVSTGTIWGGLSGPSGARMTIKLLA